LVGGDFDTVAVMEPLCSLLQEERVSCIGFIVAVRLWVLRFLVETVDDWSWGWLVRVTDTKIDEVFAFSGAAALRRAISPKR